MNPSLQTRRFWVLTLAAVLMTGLTFSLGQWQLRRAAQKEAVQAAIDKQKSLPALDNRALLATKNIADVVHREALLEGTWQPAHTVYLDNRPMAKRTGFWVMTPLALSGSGQWIVVQRGWVPRDFGDRTRLPEVATPGGVVAVRGRMAPPPSKLYEFDGAERGPIRQNLDLDAFRTETGASLLQASLLQTGGAGEGLSRDWPAPASGVDKHYGYAFQWFALSGLFAGLYVWFQLIVPRRSKRHGPVSGK